MQLTVTRATHNLNLGVEPGTFVLAALGAVAN